MPIERSPDTLVTSEPTVIEVDRKTYDAFIALIDAPPQPNERLHKLMRTPAPWER